ncbi:MAG: polyprenyl diphosphate synthase [Caulobacterales bacterium]|nr:polyprenyl diphosphate synthase [Caulobacterales bacterium]
MAIIMDGNGRWARARGRPRAFGHRAGVEAVRRAVRVAGDLGVRHLTLFGFSTENWSRPREEVDELLDLLRRFVDEDLAKLAGEGVRVHVIGGRGDLSPSVLEIVTRAEERTSHNDRFHLTIAFNYGGCDEIVRAARAAMQDAVDGRVSPDELDEARFEGYLDTAGAPPIDLLIRTSGERRISNFLLWQLAYSELVFLDVLWPDFGHDHFAAALDEFAARERRFGGVVSVDAE